MCASRDPTSPDFGEIKIGSRNESSLISEKAGAQLFGNKMCISVLLFMFLIPRPSSLGGYRVGGPKGVGNGHRIFACSSGGMRWEHLVLSFSLGFCFGAILLAGCQGRGGVRRSKLQSFGASWYREPRMTTSTPCANALAASWWQESCTAATEMRLSEEVSGAAAASSPLRESSGETSRSLLHQPAEKRCEKSEGAGLSMSGASTGHGIATSRLAPQKTSHPTHGWMASSKVFEQLKGVSELSQ